MKVLVQFRIVLADDSGKVLEDEIQHDICEILDVEIENGIVTTEKEVSHLCSNKAFVVGTGNCVSVAIADWLKNLCALNSYVPYREKRRQEIASIREQMRGVSGEELDEMYASGGVMDSGILEAFKDEYRDRGRRLP